MSTEEILIAKVNRMDVKINQLTNLIKSMAAIIDGKPTAEAKEPGQWLSRREWMERYNKSGDQWRYLVDNNKDDPEIVKETRKGTGRYLVNIHANI